MAASSDALGSVFHSNLCTTVVLYHSTNPFNISKAHSQATIDEIARKSFEMAKFETLNLHPIEIETEFEPHISLPEGLDPNQLLRARSRLLEHVLPSLEGPYRVGYQKTTLDVPNPSVLGTDSQIGVEIYAPTQQPLGGSRLVLPVFGHILEKVLSIRQIESLHTHAREGIVPIKQLPILIFSHGFGFNPAFYRILLEQVASHGFVVLSLNHPSSSNPEPDLTPEKIENLALTQANNIKFVIEQIRNGEFQEFGLVDRLTLAGHSLGGAASVMVSQDDPSILGCVNIDGALRGDEALRTKGLTMPVLTILSDHQQDLDDETNVEAWQIHGELQSFHKSSNHSTLVTIPQIGHTDFSIYPFLEWLVGEKTELYGEKTYKYGEIALENSTQGILSLLRDVNEIKDRG